MKTIRHWLERHKAHTPFFIVFIIALFVVVRSYEPGTYLSGWDTLHPEFNLRLYAERVLFGAWQEHQGLGAPASQAHAAELPRLPILFALDVLLPQSAVRHAFFYLMYLAGIAGVYVFIQDSWFEKEKERRYHWAAAFGALLYGLNLGTLQHFYVPLEMFAVHYATIGWLIWSVWKFIKTSRIKYLGWYFLFQVLSAPSAHTATLFYMYSFVVFIFIGAFAFVHHWNRKWLALKKIAVLTGTMLAAHSYWMLPNLYYIFQHSGYVQEAKISRHFSTEAFWQNQAFGAFHNVLILKNFLFNWKDFSFAEGRFVVLFDEWNKYLRSAVGYPFLYLTAAVYLGGVVIAAVKSKKQGIEKVAFLVLFLLPFFFLNNLNLPSEYLFSLLQKSSSTFREALRFPFTKFSILYMLAAAVFFAEGWKTLYRLAPKLLSKQYQRASKLLVVIATFLLIILPNYPALQGFLVSNSMKVTYPEHYFEMFEWFEQQPREGRIVKLPVTDFWGWTYHDWSLLNTPQGYQGAGFIWFGLPQPIMDREFDRWVSTNEYFYRELSYLIRSNDAEGLETLLQKYQIKWLIFDSLTIDPDHPEKNFVADYYTILGSTNNIGVAWQSGPLTVYENVANQEGWLTSEPVYATSTKTDFVQADPIYDEFNNYYLSTETESQVEYPFVDLLKEETDENFSISENSASTQRAIQGQYDNLVIPSWTAHSSTLPVNLWVQMTEENEVILTINSILPEIEIDGKSFPINSFAETSSITVGAQIASPQEEYVLVINDTFIFFPHSQEQIFLGSFVIPVESPQFHLYSAQSDIAYPLLTTNRIFVNDCETGAPDSSKIEYQLLENGVTLKSDGAVACASDGIFRNIEGPGLLSVSFEHQSATANTATRICLFARGVPGCLNSDPLYTYSSRGSNQNVQVFQEIDRPIDINISFNLDAKDNHKEITYSNALLEFNPLATSIDVPMSELNRLLPLSGTIPIDGEAKFISISQTFGLESELLQGRGASQYAHLGNCGDHLGYGGGETISDKLIVSAYNSGVACVFYSFEQISPQQEYVLLTEAENINGRELRIAVSDQSSNVMQEIFEPYEIKKKNIMLSSERATTSLSVEFYGDSFGNYPSENKIGSLSLFPFPNKWVGNLRLQDVELNATHELEMTETKRLANYYYLAKVHNSNNNTGLLKLSQSYDHQWHIINLNNPFQTFKHVRVNNWANGWLVPSGTHYLLIIYWQQLALFCGLLLLIITGVLLIFLMKKHHDDWFEAKGARGYILKKKLLRLLTD